MKLSTVFKILGLAFFILFALCLRPVPIATESNTYDYYTEVEHIFEGGPYDVTFRLKNFDGYPYINRGLQRGLKMEYLTSKLIGSSVHLKFVDHWTPLDYNKSHPTVAYIALEESGEVIYNSIKP